MSERKDIAPSGYRRAETCDNCSKCELVTTYPHPLYVCNEATKYHHRKDGSRAGYDGIEFYTTKNATCDKHDLRKVEK